MTTATCTCCSERPAYPEALARGYAWCEECSRGASCDTCGQAIEDDGRRQWESAVCESCAERAATSAAIDALEAQVRELAAEHEWECELASQADTGSRYFDLRRECDCCLLGDEGDCTCESLRVRVSDHGSAYCREHFSLVVAGHESGDDHTLAALAKRLARPKTGETE